jgi:uncharacterized membrane protein
VERVVLNALTTAVRTILAPSATNLPSSSEKPIHQGHRRACKPSIEIVVLRQIELEMESFRQLMEIIGTAVDGVGVFIVAAGAIVATARLLVRRSHNTGNYYSSYRQDIGRAILLGLEFLIAGDIIRTVVVAPTIQNVLVLGLIVLIRTFLSLSLQLEIEGRLPWRREGLPPD